MADVLVLLSTYNGEKYLRAQLDSILKQSIPVEVLIRDDGSKDDTIKIVEEYSKTNKNINYEIGTNKGVVGSYIELMKKAKGYSYYALSDQDDVWMLDKLEIACNRLNELNLEKPCLYASCSLIVDNDMNGTEKTQFNRRGINFYNVIIQNLMPAHSQVMNQHMIDFVLSNPLDMNKIFMHDYWLALLAITFGEFYFDNQYHTYYRQHEENVLGYGHGHLSWFVERVKHVKNEAARQITRQDQYFYDIFSDKLDENQSNELRMLLNSQRNFFTRLGYLKIAHVYRQRKIETALFYILYLFGGYKLKGKEDNVC